MKIYQNRVTVQMNAPQKYSPMLLVVIHYFINRIKFNFYLRVKFWVLPIVKDLSKTSVHTASLMMSFQ